MDSRRRARRRAGADLAAAGTSRRRRRHRAAPCGTVNIAVNPWVGYEANAAVVAYVLKTRLGCTVELKNLTEEVSWQGFGTGDGRRRSWRTGATTT